MMIVAKVCDLRARLPLPSDRTSDERTTKEAYALDMELLRWQANCPKAYAHNSPPEKLMTPASPFAQEEREYADVFSAGLNNYFRAIRILLQDVVLHYLGRTKGVTASLSPQFNDSTAHHDNQIQSAKAVAAQLGYEICASVPYFIEPYSLQRGPGIQVLGGNVLTWSLYMAACTPVVTDEMCNWIMERLKIISHGLGIRLAARMAHLTATTPLASQQIPPSQPIEQIPSVFTPLASQVTMAPTSDSFFPAVTCQDMFTFSEYDDCAGWLPDMSKQPIY